MLHCSLSKVKIIQLRMRDRQSSQKPSSRDAFHAGKVQLYSALHQVNYLKNNSYQNFTNRQKKRYVVLLCLHKQYLQSRGLQYGVCVGHTAWPTQFAYFFISHSISLRLEHQILCLKNCQKGKGSFTVHANIFIQLQGGQLQWKSLNHDGFLGWQCQMLSVHVYVYFEQHIMYTHTVISYSFVHPGKSG